MTDEEMSTAVRAHLAREERIRQNIEVSIETKQRLWLAEKMALLFPDVPRGEELMRRLYAHLFEQEL